MKQSFFLIFLISCNRDENNADETNKFAFRTLDSSRDSLSFEADNGSYNLKYSSFIIDDKVYSEFTVVYETDLSFTINYDIDTQQEHWKLKQAPIIIEKATELNNSDIPIQILSDISEILNQSIAYIYSETIETKNIFLISSINFHKSILNSSIRSISTNENCDCTVHPEFLIDKTFFNCQEEHFYNTSSLKNILNEYVVENDSIDISTQNLITYLDNYSESEIRFDEYYSFYIESHEFNLFISNMISSANDDCGWYCVLGCGSDHGCCGNYSGCCIYWHASCYLHDKICTDCEPAWFCLKGCKPDTKPIKPANLSLQVS